MLTFHLRYLVFAILIFSIEVLIALFIHDGIVRPYIGDFLVVILIYCSVKTFFNFSVLKTAIGVLIFSYGVEILQYFDIVEKLYLQDYEIARIIIGTSFEWIDILSYTLGIASILLIENVMIPRSAVKDNK